MPQSYKQKMELIQQDGDYWKQTLAAMLEVATDVENEDVENVDWDWGTGVMRKALSVAIKKEPTRYVSVFLYLVIMSTSPVFPDAPNDTDFKNYVSARWNDVISPEMVIEHAQKLFKR